MAFQNMISEMRGVIPNYSALLARTHLKEAWREVRNMRGWSFQLAQGGFSTPPKINQGLATVTFGSPDVAFDAVGTYAILTEGSQYGSLITQRQFRIGASSIYNIIALGVTGTVAYVTIASAGSGQNPGIYNYPVLDNTGPGADAVVQIVVDPDGTATTLPIVLSAGSGYVDPVITFNEGGTPATFTPTLNALLTLDRPWTDVTAPSPVPPQPVVTLGYTIYQCYYAAPVKGFQAWESVLDVVNVIWLNTQPTKKERDRIQRADPQRQIFANPGTVLSMGADMRSGSSTLGWMLFELYPQPQAIYSYQTWYSFDGPELDAPTDTLPHPMSEDCLKARARAKAYMWAESNRDSTNPRGQSADYRFLVGESNDEFKAALKDIRMLDLDLVNLWYNTMTRLTGLGPLSTFDPATGRVLSRNM